MSWCTRRAQPIAARSDPTPKVGGAAQLYRRRFGCSTRPVGRDGQMYPPRLRVSVPSDGGAEPAPLLETHGGTYTAGIADKLDKARQRQAADRARRRPVEALQGVSPGDAEHLKAAFNIKTSAISDATSTSCGRSRSPSSPSKARDVRTDEATGRNSPVAHRESTSVPRGGRRAINRG